MNAFRKMFSWVDCPVLSNSMEKFSVFLVHFLLWRHLALFLHSSFLFVSPFPPPLMYASPRMCLGLQINLALCQLFIADCKRAKKSINAAFSTKETGRVSTQSSVTAPRSVALVVTDEFKYQGQYFTAETNLFSRLWGFCPLLNSESLQNEASVALSIISSLLCLTGDH